LPNFLGDEAVPGQHVICFTLDWNMTVFRESWAENEVIIPSSSGSKTWIELESLIDKELGLTRRRSQPREYPIQNWAIYTKDGELIVHEGQTNFDEEQTLYSMIESGIVIVFEGGVWFWPGIREGFTRHIILDYLPGQGYGVLEKRNATLVTLSLNPLVLSVEGFLEERECDFIQEQALPRLKYSYGKEEKGLSQTVQAHFRTSQITYLGPFLGPAKFGPLMEGVDNRTASLVRIPRSHQEYVQVLRYGRLEKYDSHHDYFGKNSCRLRHERLCCNALIAFL
jgi:prolyl 4-hydroxylase